MSMNAFAYHRPETLRRAAGMLARDPEAKLLAGGHTLLPAMKLRLAGPSALIDITGLDALKGIEATPRRVSIGALATHAEVADSAAVRAAVPALARLARTIGDPHVRARGTIGGSVANNDPSADYPAALVALDAVVVTDRRRLPAEAFFTGLYETALEEGEIVTRVLVPPCARAGYAKVRNPASRYALAGVFVAKRAGGVRVAVIGAGDSGVFRWAEAEAALSRRFAPRALEGLSPDPAGMNGDLHAGPEYRAHLVGVLARRAVEEARAGAAGAPPHGAA